VVCDACGRPERGVTAVGETACPVCADRHLRSIDADFLDDYARFGARSRQVVAEACLRALVLSDSSDRKLLAMTIYEQFVAAATDFIGLYHALLNRRNQPIVKGVLGFELDAPAAVSFFNHLSGSGPAELLLALGLPHAEQTAALPATYDRRERKQIKAALAEAHADLERLGEFRTVGERALVNASRRLGGPRTLTDRAGWLVGKHLSAGQVAALALSQDGRGLEINLLGTDEDTLGAVVDGIDIVTRLSRNIIFAFVSLNGPAAFRDGFPSGD
jgi:hypothetical protein